MARRNLGRSNFMAARVVHEAKCFAVCAVLLVPAGCNTPLLTERREEPIPTVQTMLIWTTSDQTWTEMLVVDSLVVYGTIDGYVVARDRFTGSERWRFATTGAGAPVGSAARHLRRVGETVVWAQGNAYALDVRTGVVRWTIKPSGSRYSGIGPAADSANVYLYRGRLISAVRVRDGHLMWEDSATAYDSPTNINIQAAGGRVLASRNARLLGEPQVVALDAVTGAELWNAWPMPEQPWPDTARCCFSVALDDEVALTIGFGSEVYAHDITDGRVLWSSAVKRPSSFQTAALLGDMAIVSAGSVVTAYDRRTGVQRWEFTRTPSATHPFVAVDGDRLGFCFAGTGTAIIDRQSGVSLLEIERETRNASGLGALRCFMGVGIKDDWLYHGTSNGEIVGIRWSASR